mmetsp:Transcript_28830/g.76006  ORF Transcript_28830/g.76006 Transcript_28830/m.76006 type:complete len:263 (-) Transcript_28830:18-806(-)
MWTERVEELQAFAKMPTRQSSTNLNNQTTWGDELLVRVENTHLGCRRRWDPSHEISFGGPHRIHLQAVALPTTHGCHKEVVENESPQVVHAAPRAEAGHVVSNESKTVARTVLGRKCGSVRKRERRAEVQRHHVLQPPHPAVVAGNTPRRGKDHGALPSDSHQSCQASSKFIADADTVVIREHANGSNFTVIQVVEVGRRDSSRTITGRLLAHLLEGDHDVLWIQRQATLARIRNCHIENTIHIDENQRNRAASVTIHRHEN